MKEYGLKMENGVSTWQPYSAETAAFNSLFRMLLELCLCIQMDILNTCEGVTLYSVSDPLLAIGLIAVFLLL